MFNGSRKINKWLKFGSSIQLSRSVKNAFNENDEYRGVIANAVLLDPLTPVEYTGTIPGHVQALIDAGQPLMTSDNGNYYGISKYVEGETINPFVQNLQLQRKTTDTKLMSNIYMDITPLDGLTFTSKLGISYYSRNEHVYKPSYYYNGEMLNLNPSVSEADGMMTYWQWENYASYNKSLGNHDFTILAGTAVSSRELKTVNAEGYPLIKDQESYANLDYISSQTNSTVGGNTIEDNKLSFFTRINYNYASKYLFQATVRRDAAGLSILPKEQRWGTFPSFSAGWVISSEDFFPKNDVFSYLKLRCSWGQNGSLSNLGNYSYASTVSSSGDALSTITWSYINASNLYPLANGSYAIASYPSVLGNRELTWETSEQLDIGLDARFFKGSLGLVVDYYKKTTKDLITENTPPFEAGNNASPVNGGNVVNKGLEFEINYRNQIGALEYNITGNLSTLDNEVTYLNPSISRLPGADINKWISATAFEEGLPVWYFRGYKTDGIDPETGDINIVDVNKDGEITTSDFTYIGSAIPDITYGATLNLKYKSFDLSVFVQGQSGNEVLMGMIRTDRPTTNKLSLFYEDRWTPKNKNASRPSATVDAKYWSSDQMVFDGSFTKIKQIQFGYSLPKTLCEKLYLKKTRVYISLDDYFTFTDYPGMDPEAASSQNNSIGIDRGYFPISKKVLFGLSLNF
jgi:TonB-linked SusC/RagA family outer membrane protein